MRCPIIDVALRTPAEDNDQVRASSHLGRTESGQLSCNASFDENAEQNSGLATEPRTARVRILDCISEHWRGLTSTLQYFQRQINLHVEAGWLPIPSHYGRRDEPQSSLILPR